MSKLIFVLGILMGIIAFSSCSGNKTTMVVDNPKNSPAEDPGIDTISIIRSGGIYDTCDYMSQSEIITNRMKKNLNLTFDQEKAIRRINEQRASRLYSALEIKAISEPAWMEEVSRINELSNEEYKNALTEKQYNYFISFRGNYKEFQLFCVPTQVIVDSTQIEAGNNRLRKKREK